MRCAVLLAVLAACALPAAARDYYWAGGDMAFSNTANWVGGNAPSATFTPCSTTFGGRNATIVSNLDAGQYNVGQIFNLPADGTLMLASDGTVINFADAATSGCGSQTATWTGGLVPEERNDFFCHTNWKVKNSQGVLVANGQVPCDTDVLNFDGTKTYHTSILPSLPLITVSAIKLSSTVTVTSNSSAQLAQGLPQISLYNNATVIYIGGAAADSVCVPMNQYTTDALGVASCICSSSCPTLEMIQAADNRARAGILSLANQTLAAMNTYFVRTFTGTMNAASLFVSGTQLGTALNSGNNAAIATAIQQALVDLPAASVTGVTVSISSDNSTVTVTGTINATAGSLLPIGFSSLNPPGNLVWASTTSQIPNNVTRTQMIVQATLGSQIFAVYASVLSSQAVTRTQQQTADIQAIVLAITNATNIPNALAAITGATCFSSCGANCASCQSTLQTALAAAGAADPATLAAQVATLSGSTYASNAATIASIVNQVLAANAALTSSAAAAMQTYTLSSPTIYIGRYSALLNQLLAIAPQNTANVKSSLEAAIANFQSIRTVSNLQFSYVDPVPAPVARRAVLQSSSGLAVTFNYTTSCLPSDTACRAAFTAGSSTGSLVQQRLDNTFNLLTFLSGQCFNPSFSSLCVKAAGETTCATSLANTNNVTVALADARTAMLDITRCGTYPRFPNGTCLQVDPNAAGNVDSLTLTCGITTPAPTTTTTAGPTTQVTVVAASSSSGGGMSIVPIAAAAGGGALLLVIVVILLMRRKRNATRGPAKKVDDRTVVAFENPMYDDPAQNAASQPVYDAAAPHDAEGLYDEPAFNQNAQKANPVYQSTEDLAAGSEYMEQPGMAAKGDGYLDVAPGAAEDVGYLDGVEKQ